MDQADRPHLKKIMRAGDLSKQTALRDLQGTRASLEEAQLAAWSRKRAAAAAVDEELLDLLL